MGLDTNMNSGDMERTFPYYKRVASNAFDLLVVDSLVIGCAVLIGDLVLFWVNRIPVYVNASLLLIPVWWLGAYFLKLAPSWGLGPVEEIRRVQILLVAVFAIAAASLFLSRLAGTASRITFLMAYLLSVVFLPLGRSSVKRMLIQREEWGLPVVIYGNDHTVEYVIAALKEERGLGYTPIGIFDDETAVGQSIKGVPVLGGISDRTRTAPCAILAAPSMPREQLVSLIDGPLAMYQRVIIIPDLLEAPSLWVKPLDFIGLLGLEIASNLLNPVSGFVKYTAEWLIVVLTIPIWLPLCGLIALAVWLGDHGSPFFLQERVGKGGRRFKIIKFRTMCLEAERVLHEQLRENEDLRLQWEQKYKLKNDPRITRIGRLLRISSLDELPQLFNVLMGQMSLVGPRPVPQYHSDQLPERVQKLRRRVRPGITGLWQVSGRSDTGGIEGMERWDSYYVRNWSIWLDIVILARTFRTVLSRRGAY